MIFVLTVPPSVNSMFYNIPGKGRRKSRRYCEWIRGELKTLVAQKAKPFVGRAIVSITLPSHVRGDCDNRIKPVLDLLVRAGILADDRSDYVAGVSCSYVEDQQCCHVKIESAP